MNSFLMTALTGLVLIAVVYMALRKRALGLRIAGVAVALLVVIAGGVMQYRGAVNGGEGLAGKTATLGDDGLMSTPLYQAIQHHEPEVWDQLQSQIQAMHHQDQDEQGKIDALQQQVLRISVQRLQQAPDKETVAYMRANMAQTAQLQQQGGETCFRFLYPEVRGGVNPVKLLTRAQITQRMDADVAMYNASFGADQHTVTPAEREQAHRDIQPIVQAMMKRYGDDFGLLAEPQKAQGKENQVCDMVQTLWSQVFDLPEANAAAVIRYSVAAGSAH